MIVTFVASVLGYDFIGITYTTSSPFVTALKETFRLESISVFRSPTPSRKFKAFSLALGSGMMASVSLAVISLFP